MDGFSRKRGVETSKVEDFDHKLNRVAYYGDFFGGRGFSELRDEGSLVQHWLPGRRDSTGFGRASGGGGGRGRAKQTRSMIGKSAALRDCSVSQCHITIIAHYDCSYSYDHSFRLLF